MTAIAAHAPTHDSTSLPDTGVEGAVIELVDVTKTYGEGTSAFQALRGVDLEIRHGESWPPPDRADRASRPQ